LLPWLRPSNVAAATTIRLGTRWAAGDTSASIVGKLVHRWFEEVRGWIEDYKPNKKRLKEIAASSLTQEEMSHVKVTEWVDRFVRFCEMPSVLKALSADRYRSWHQPRMLHLEITNERRLLQVIDGQMLRGVIDRCVLGFDGDRVVRAEILDFKTDKCPEGMDLTEWVDSRVEHHRPQLECYRRVLSEQFGLHPRDIHLTLLLLSEDKEVTLDER
jgi:ATP-dependent exoDNAse (exonuclease V) beta subunit